MPPRPGELTERTLSIRKLFQRIEQQPGTILCMAPEGQDQPGGLLGIPHPGTGKLIARICLRLHQILPVGVYEEDCKLVLRFGPAFKLDRERFSDNDVLHQVMHAISCLLPSRLVPENYRVWSLTGAARQRSQKKTAKLEYWPRFEQTNGHAATPARVWHGHQKV